MTELLKSSDYGDVNVLGFNEKYNGSVRALYEITKLNFYGKRKLATVNFPFTVRTGNLAPWVVRSTLYKLHNFG